MFYFWQHVAWLPATSCLVYEGLKPPRLPRATFNNLKHIPHPTPMDDDHYCPFSEAFNMVTTEEHRPTFKSPKQIKKKRKLHFYATIHMLRMLI